MAAGIPVVSFAVHGISELLGNTDSPQGLFVAPEPGPQTVTVEIFLLDTAGERTIVVPRDREHCLRAARPHARRAPARGLPVVLPHEPRRPANEPPFR